MHGKLFGSKTGPYCCKPGNKERMCENAFSLYDTCLNPPPPLYYVCTHMLHRRHPKICNYFLKDEHGIVFHLLIDTSNLVQSPPISKPNARTPKRSPKILLNYILSHPHNRPMTFNNLQNKFPFLTSNMLIHALQICILPIGFSQHHTPTHNKLPPLWTNCHSPTLN